MHMHSSQRKNWTRQWLRYAKEWRKTWCFQMIKFFIPPFSPQAHTVNETSKPKPTIARYNFRLKPEKKTHKNCLHWLSGNRSKRNKEETTRWKNIANTYTHTRVNNNEWRRESGKSQKKQRHTKKTRYANFRLSHKSVKILHFIKSSNDMLCYCLLFSIICTDWSVILVS